MQVLRHFLIRHAQARCHFAFVQALQHDLVAQLVAKLRHALTLGLDATVQLGDIKLVLCGDALLGFVDG